MVFVGLEDFLTVDEMNDEQFIFFISNGLKIYNEFYTVNVFFQKEKQHILNRALQIKQKNNIKNYYQKKLDNIINTFKSF
jgi:predicted RNA-binding protein associated with RNAse of E/G family